MNPNQAHRAIRKTLKPRSSCCSGAPRASRSFVPAPHVEVVAALELDRPAVVPMKIGLGWWAATDSGRLPAFGDTQLLRGGLRFKSETGISPG